MTLYISVAEFKQAPTSIDYTTLDQDNYGNQAAQDASLLNVLRRASSWVDTIVQQETLEATVNTELKEVRMSRDGRINVHVNNTPIIQLQKVEYRTSPLEPFKEVNLTDIEVKDSWFTIYGVHLMNSLESNIFIGNRTPYYRKSDIPITVRYTYVNGWTNTILAANVAANSKVVTLADPTGLVPGQRLTLYDGPTQETVTVESVAGNSVTLMNPLLFDHAKLTTISAIPDNVKQATLLLAMYLIKERGSLAVTMQESQISTISYNTKKSDDLSVARELLQPYKRVVTS
ncbi:hypothetical protein OWP19_23870 [Bacillus cereus]|uniref:hypothetical protein n=1 Tax=Bacillus cereus TaxID=1396 RepID=UPI00254A75C5|nr:hypothetical protein [Bacillus cereus]MDK7481009.1 hypothetical protein [Bacillus cereus]